MNIMNIARGWWDYANATPYTKNLMEKRLAICDACPNKKQLSKAGKLLVQFVNEEGNLFQCGLCGCPLSALTSRPEASCKDKRWLPAGEESYY
jgi:hypothetical protein